MTPIGQNSPMEDIHEEIVNKMKSQALIKPFFIAERLIHDPKKRIYHVHVFNKQYTELLTNLANQIETDTVVVIDISNGAYIEKIDSIFRMKGLEISYVEVGTPFTKIQERDAIKAWSGWHTFPQIFVNGYLIGGHEELRKAFDDGTLDKIINVKKTTKSTPNSPVPVLKKKPSLKKFVLPEKSDYELDDQFLKKCQELSNITLADLNVDEKFRLDETEFRKPYNETFNLLKKLNDPLTPDQQFKIIEKAINQMPLEVEYHYKKNLKYKTEVIVGIDDMLPIFIYSLIRAKIQKMYSIFRVLTDFVDVKSSDGYCLATLDTAIQSISGLKPKKQVEWNWNNILLNDF